MRLTLDKQREELWLLRFRRGDRDQQNEVFRELFECFRPGVISLCLHLTGTPDQAEDAVQETFLSIFRALGEFRGEAKLSTWIYRVAIRASYRVRASQPCPAEPIPLDLSGTPPEEEILLRERERLLQQAVLQLPLEQRVVFSLFMLRHLSQKEISEVLQIPEGTVWSRLHAAKVQLTQALVSLSK
jgi:RNA polymerase sigma-70 factor, ECF subfamily